MYIMKIEKLGTFRISEMGKVITKLYPGTLMNSAIMIGDAAPSENDRKRNPGLCRLEESTMTEKWVTIYSVVDDHGRRVNLGELETPDHTCDDNVPSPEDVGSGPSPSRD